MAVAGASMVRALADEFAACSLDDLDVGERRALVGRIRRTQSLLAGVVSTLARLDAADVGPAPAVDLLIADGSVPGAQARREQRRADVAEVLPEVGQAHEAGLIPPAHVDAVASALGRLDDAASAEFAQHGAWLRDEAKDLPVETFRRRVNDLARSCESASSVAERESRQVEASRVDAWIDDVTGMGITRLTLDPVRHAELHGRIDAVKASLVADGAKRCAATDVAAFLAVMGDGVAGPGFGVGSGAPRIAVHVDLETVRSGFHPGTLCETDDGVPIGPAAFGRLTCEADWWVVVMGPDGVVDRAAKVERLATARQRRALAAMYPTCGHPGCDVPFSRCEVHHVEPWNGSNTTIDNLLPLCVRHHHAEHDNGWRHELRPDRMVVAWRTDGSEVARGRPPGRRVGRSDGVSDASSGPPIPADDEPP